MLPSAAECRAYWRELGAPPALTRHLEAVNRVATALVAALKQRGHRVDERLVEAAALLHDLGRVRTQGAAHGVESAKLVRAKGWDEKLARAVACHVGGGLDDADIHALRLEHRHGDDYMPRSLEEKVVCLADKLIGLDERQPLEAEYARLRGQGLHRAVERIEGLRREFATLTGRDPEQV